jgi:2-oxoglutarate dehydrogenase E2 component (dihydrolipoamide succinyltransferase)
MSIEIKVPTLPESIADATIAQWHKTIGDFVKRDENLLDLETDKVMLEVPAPQDGILQDILKPQGSKVTAHEVLGILVASKDSAEKSTAAKAKDVSSATAEKQTATPEKAALKTGADDKKNQTSDNLSPAVRKLIAEQDIDIDQIQGTGKGGRITKEDVLAHVQTEQGNPPPNKDNTPVPIAGERPEKRVPMTRLRARIAERLVEAQHNAAMLTTFNEINMQPVMDLRNRYKDVFEKTHHAKLGFMSFFVKAAIEALKRFPVVNASIDEHDIVYHGYCDIGIAISTTRGLVVPILRDVETMSMADIEKAIVTYAEKARDGKLQLEEMTGGTFTITNGGIFGSMLSTPIINAPQCAILGMHNIVKRPVVENDEIVIRPIMYVALSYDHRLIDGRESVSFLLTIKQLLEDPSRLLLGV